MTEVLSSQKFAEYVSQSLSVPLRMRESDWRMPDERLSRMGTVYRTSQGKLTRETDANTRRFNVYYNRLTAGGFGLASTVDDYMRSRACFSTG